MDKVKLYNEDMNKLITTLETIIESGEYTMLVKSYGDANTLEYGIIGQKMENVKFENLDGECFWEFLYKGIYTVAPNSIVNIMHVNAFGDYHDDVSINLNENVVAILVNREHKYDALLLSYKMQLSKTMKNNLKKILKKDLF